MEMIIQPSETNRLGEYLNENLGRPWTHFRAAVAFVKSSGTRHIEETLRVFSMRSEVEIIVGIDHRGTSYQALDALLECVVPPGRVIVFHNRGSLTFHPKIFLFKSPESADVVVGSGNLTGGGLYGNYEAGLRLRLNLTDPTHAATLQRIEDALDQWADTTTGIARLLDRDLLAKLLARGYAPIEQVGGDQTDGGVEYGEVLPGQDDFLFASHPEPRPPTLSGRRRPVPEPGPNIFDDVIIHDPVPPEPIPGIADQPVPELPHPLTFVMTLQQTDAGVGQTTAGTAQRSPEIFIPLAARDLHPDFWQWPNGFVGDDAMPGKLDRNHIFMRLGDEVIEASLTYFPHRHDFRLRNSTLRNAGNIGDILRIERVVDPGEVGYEYDVAIVPQGDDAYEDYIEFCQERVRNSLKLYGYN